jgi:hypothetical protein
MLTVVFQKKTSRKILPCLHTLPYGMAPPAVATKPIDFIIKVVRVVIFRNYMAQREQDFFTPI